MAEYIQYLFNSSGDWIATQVGMNVFSVNKKWLGWVRKEDHAVITPENTYLGTILCNNRLFYCEAYLPILRDMATVRTPPAPENPGDPAQEAPQAPPPGARDLTKL